MDDTNKRMSNFIEKAKLLHGNRYDYSQVVYKNAKTPVNIMCYIHGVFSQLPDQHIRTHNTSKHTNTGGCPQCAQQSRIKTKQKSIAEFVEQANTIHNSKYTYHNAVYVNTHTKLIITCPEHGDFSMTPKDHLTGKQGCRLCCYRKHHSGKAIRWLEQIEQHNNCTLQRIGRGKEYKIPNTRFHADGYDAATNTIYEFYGNKFHGNPDIYSESDTCHPFNKTITAGELYHTTLERETLVQSMGYNLVTIWESEFTD